LTSRGGPTTKRKAWKSDPNWNLGHLFSREIKESSHWAQDERLPINQVWTPMENREFGLLTVESENQPSRIMNRKCRCTLPNRGDKTIESPEARAFTRNIAY
jgi:hypothetical protein